VISAEPLAGAGFNCFPAPFARTSEAPRKRWPGLLMASAPLPRTTQN